MLGYGAGSPRRQAHSTAPPPHLGLDFLSLPARLSVVEVTECPLGRVLYVPLEASRTQCEKEAAALGGDLVIYQSVTEPQERRLALSPPTPVAPAKVAEEAEVWAFVTAAQDFVS